MTQKPFSSSWKNLLMEIYNSPSGKVREQVHLTPKKEYTPALAFLVDNSLVTRLNLGDDKNPNIYFHLTPKGFDVALQIEKNNQTNFTNTMMVVLTFLLVTNGIYVLLLEIQFFNKLSLIFSYLFVIFSSFLILYYKIIK